MPSSPLAPGSRGPRVARLNAALATLGYGTRPGSRYTDATRHAVMAFQKVHGLRRDGIARRETVEALRAPSAPDPGHGPRDRIVVDLGDQVLLVVREGRVRMVVNASTGDPRLPDGRGETTPVGTYRVGRKFAGPEQAQLGTLHWPSYFHGGIAVHGSESVPAGPASHGCVRVPMHLARTLFDVMRTGMVVQVRR